MPNPFNALNPINNMNMGAIQNVYQMFANAQNPMQVFQQMAQRNPQLQPIVQALRNGGNPQQIFNNMCQQRGINPNDFIRSITGRNTY